MSTPKLAWQWSAALINGEHVAVYGMVPPDDAPDAVKEGLARRAHVNGGGTCPEPCGARMPSLNRAQRRAVVHGRQPIHVAVVHVADCPAADENLLPLLGRRRP